MMLQVQEAKRRQDKVHKKPPPPKPAKQKGGPKPPEVQHTAPLVVCDDRYGKRQIQQNWTEERNLPSSDSDTEDEQLLAADFEKLLELPASSASHFLLSSEKRWLQPDTDLPGEDEKNRYSEYFRIDTKLLNASLGCIPFYERHGYDETLFSTLELNLMRQKAEIHTNKFQQTFADQLSSNAKVGPVSQKHKENMPPPPRKPQPTPCFVGKFASPKLNDSVGGTETNQLHVSKEPVKPVEAKLSELKIEPEVSKTVPKIVPKVEPTVATTSTNPSPQGSGKDSKEDIQQWLDDILDI
uniref:Uncharacterized protein n=1 Tax=Anopheles melas TaxID=34690 RepID=A0A182TSR2_9DIPT